MPPHLRYVAPRMKGFVHLRRIIISRMNAFAHTLVNALTSRVGFCLDDVAGDLVAVVSGFLGVEVKRVDWVCGETGLVIYSRISLEGWLKEAFWVQQDRKTLGVGHIGVKNIGAFCSGEYGRSTKILENMEMLPLGGKLLEFRVQIGHGHVSVAIFRDHDKPALVTYPDVAMNHMSCFQGLFYSPQAAPLLLHNFCIYHISPSGHEFGAAPISANDAFPSVNDLANQVADVLDFFCIGAAMCLGVTIGACILYLFVMNHQERVIRYFSKEVRGSINIPESDIVQSCRNLLDGKQSINVLRFLHTINGRHDLTDGLKNLHCRTLIFVGENSPFHSEAVYMASKLNKRYCALVEVQACGSVVTEE